MAIKPRIHWAWDGTIFTTWTYDTTWLLGSAIGQSDREKLDGDQLQSNTYGSGEGYCWQFADPIQLHSIKTCLPAGTNRIFNAWISNVDTPSNYNPTGNPDWTQIMFSAAYGAANFAYVESAFSPIQDAKWLLFGSNVNFNLTRSLHLFGEYNAPKFEYWNVGETAELNTLQIPLVFPNAPNSVDYHQYKSYKLKNLDSSAHDYSLTVKSIKSPASGFITDNFKLGKESDGYVKSGTIALSNVPASDFSEEIRLYGDILKNVNPADGNHYGCIDTEETA
jgi:hypothetical protein